jgi:hypothetical protein
LPMKLTEIIERRKIMGISGLIWTDSQEAI